MKKQFKLLKILNNKIIDVGLSIDDISNYTDIDVKLLSEILAGERRIKAPVLMSLCYLLQLDFKKLVGEIL